jgi:transposase
MITPPEPRRTPQGTPPEDNTDEMSSGNVLQNVLRKCPGCPLRVFSNVSSGDVLRACPPGVCSGGVHRGVLLGVVQGVLQSVLQRVLQGVLHGILQVVNRGCPPRDPPRCPLRRSPEVSSRVDTLHILFIYRKLYSLKAFRVLFI